FEVYTTQLYGTGMLNVAFEYAASTRVSQFSPSRVRLLSTLSFLGGCLVTIVPAALWANHLFVWCTRWRWWICGIVVIGLTAIFWTGLPPIDRFFGIQHLPAPVLAQLLVFTLCGALIL